jgi:predicted phosphodiesterase
LRIAAISDIHANLPALEAVLEDIEKLGRDVQIIVAGDFLNCGPFPRETLELLRPLPNTVIIAGNHEEYVLEQDRAMRNGGVQPPFRSLFAPSIWTASLLTTEELDWLRDLPRQAQLDGPDGSQVKIVHGSPRHQTEGITPELDEVGLLEIFDGHIQPGRLWISGHTHRPVHIRWRGMTITNCGSVGAPYDSDRRASYLLAEWDEGRRDWYVEHRRLAYDHTRALQAMEANAAYDQGGPFMRLMWYGLKIGRPCELRRFVSAYSALGEYPAPPDDFPHLEKAVEAHLAWFEATHG